MTSWLEQIRQKKLPNGITLSAKSAKSHESSPKNLPDGIESSAKSAKSAAPDRQGDEVIIVGYQRFRIDYDLNNGAYTSNELKRARKIVIPGIVLRYRLRWPGGVTCPPLTGERHEGPKSQKSSTRCETCGGSDLDQMNGHSVCMGCLKRSVG